MITIKVRNLDKVKAFISDLPRGVRGEATKEGAIYLIGNDRRGLQHYPPRVNHGEGNPYQWQSDKQRRAYFASNGFGGGIPYNRKYDLRFGWKYIINGVQTKVVNALNYAGFVMGADQQRGHMADKWRKIEQVIRDNTVGMLHAMGQAVDRWIKSRQP